MIDLYDLRANLQRANAEVDDFAEPNRVLDIATPASQPRYAVSVFEQSTARRDWPTALLLVERAATVIKDYQSRMMEVERDAKSFVQRVDEEQARYLGYIASLEKRLQAHIAASASADAALSAAKTDLWEARSQNEKLANQLVEAQAEAQKYRDYIAQIETMLGDI